MPIPTSFWPMPADADNRSLYQWAKTLAEYMRSARYREFVNGSFTLSAGTSTTLALTSVLSTSFIVAIPTNAAAQSLASKPYPTTKNQGVSVVFTHGAAAGTETFDYLLIR